MSLNSKQQAFVEANDLMMQYGRTFFNFHEDEPFDSLTEMINVARTNQRDKHLFTMQLASFAEAMAICIDAGEILKKSNRRSEAI